MSPHGDEALQLGSKSKKKNYNFPGRHLVQAINIKNKQTPKQKKTKKNGSQNMSASGVKTSSSFSFAQFHHI